MLPWIIAVVVVIVGVIFLVVFIRRKREHEKFEQYLYESYGRWKRYSIEQLVEETSRITGKKEELQRRLEAFGRAGPRVVIGEGERYGSDVESQMQHIRWQLEELDREEDNIRTVLRDKRDRKERNA